jgi:thiamine biosynthesis lipoprotein
MRNSGLRFVCIAVIVAAIAGCSRIGRPKDYSRVEPVMGTFVQVKVYAPDRPENEVKRAIDGAMELARELEKSFSAFDPESEVNKLNGAGKAKVSTELFNLIKEAKRVSDITGGEFDITVAPVMKANGFYGDMPEELLEEIPDTFEGVGYENVQLGADSRTVTLVNGAWIDLSGIAKGYIVDRMAAYFRGKGLEGVLVNAGGDLYCGRREKGHPWKIGIREPGGSNIVATLFLEDTAVATSGDYENVIFDEKTGEVISHIIDPASDKAVKDESTSVTVLASSCTEADALATGMLAMGTEKALKLSEVLNGIEIITVYCPGKHHTVSYSSGAKKYITWRE